MLKEKPKPPIMGYEDDGKNIRALREQAGMENNPAERDKERFTTERLEEMERKLADEKVGDIIDMAIKKVDDRIREGRDIKKVLGTKDVHRLKGLRNDLVATTQSIIYMSEHAKDNNLLNFKNLAFSELKIVKEGLGDEKAVDVIRKENYVDLFRCLWRIDN